jgi:hypothetical protein
MYTQDMQNTTTSDTTTVTRRYEYGHHVALVMEKLAKLRQRAVKKGLNGSLDATYVDTGKVGEFRYELTLTFTGDFALGDYRPVAVIDFTSIDEGLVLTIDPDVEFGDTEFDSTRCDHCRRSVRRNKTVVVTDGDELVYVGGSCAQDFLGRNPDMLTWIAEATNVDVERDGLPTRFPTRMVIEAAIDANRIGYVKACEPAPTKDMVFAMLTGTFATAKGWAGQRSALDEAKPADATVDEVLDYMRNGSGDSDFGRNMRKLANADEIGIKGLGTVAYAPAGLNGWRDKMAAAAAKRAAAAEAKAAAEPVPVTDKRIRIEGIVTTVRNQTNDFGNTVTKIRVETDAGWACWGTLPAGCEGGFLRNGKPTDVRYENADGEHMHILWMNQDERTAEGITVEASADRGDRIAFMARIEASADDDKFGFFSRPTKGEIVARSESSGE